MAPPRGAIGVFGIVHELWHFARKQRKNGAELTAGAGGTLNSLLPGANPCRGVPQGGTHFAGQILGGASAAVVLVGHLEFSL
jgi:hypothetical protein